MTNVSVLFVCTGNICRSPMAEGVLRHRLVDHGLDARVAVDSAGLGNWHVGDPPDSRAIARAKLRGYDVTAQRARQFAASDYHDFDLILGMDAGHLAAMERRRPRESQRRRRVCL